MCAFGRMVTDDERLLLRAERLRHSLAQHPVSTTTCRATAQVEFVVARLVSVVNQLKDCAGDTGDALEPPTKKLFTRSQTLMNYTFTIHTSACPLTGRKRRVTAQVEFVMARLVSVVNQLKDCEGDTGDAFAWSEDGSQHFRDRLSMTIGGLLGEEEVTVYDVPEVRGKGTVEWVLVLTSWK